MLRDNGATIMFIWCSSCGVEKLAPGFSAGLLRKLGTAPNFEWYVLSKFLPLLKLNFTSSKDIDLPLPSG